MAAPDSSPLNIEHRELEVDAARIHGAKSRCRGVGFTILIVLALLGGVVAWIVLRPSDGSKTTTPGPRPDPEAQGGKHCVSSTGGNCLECDDGYELFGTNRCFYKCHTDLAFDVVNGPGKGLALDDTTLHWCPENLPFHWPNTDEPVTSIRMFKAWQSNWNEAGLDKEEVWRDIARYLQTSGARVLIGTQVTCSKEDDDRDWEDVKKMMKIFGSDHIMGLSVGNEMELLYVKDLGDSWVECMTLVWTEHYYLDTFHNRVRDMDSLGPAYSSIPVMSVFSAAIFVGWPFVNEPVNTTTPLPGQPRPNAGLVVDFLNNVTSTFGYRWIWALNVYPYWDPTNNLDEDGIHCVNTLARATCLRPTSGDPQDCLFTGLVAGMRDRMDAAGARNGTLWVGETGWSFPQSEELSSEVKACDEFSSEETFQRYYKTFLEWDMDLTGNYTGEGPDHVFWFTMRDSANFGKVEGFGLIGAGDPTQWCTNTTCKLQDKGLFTTSTPYTGPPTTDNMSTTSTPLATSTTASSSTSPPDKSALV